MSARKQVSVCFLSQERSSKFTALQCMFYSIILIPISITPRVVGLTGNVGMWVMIACGIMFFAASVVFYKKNDYPSAKRVMFAFVHLSACRIAGIVV